MVNKLIEEINLALDNNLYLVALNTALTLPDICGKAEYPELKTAERYKKWYQENIGQHEQRPDDKENNIDFPYLSDNVVYQLRCSLLHQGNPNIEKGKTGIDEFTLAIEEKNQFELYADSASLETYCNECKKTYTVNVRRLCFILCQTAKIYYENNKEKVRLVDTFRKFTFIYGRLFRARRCAEKCSRINGLFVDVCLLFAFR